MRVAIFNDTRTESKHFGCDVVMRNLERLLCASGLDPVWRWPVAQDWRARLDELPKCGSVDAVIVNGEGSLHDSESSMRPDMLADVAKMAKEHLKVPAFLINATLFKNSLNLYKKLGGFQKIFVRDSLSLAELRRHQLDGTVVPDLTFAFPDVIETGIQREGVGATDSILSHVKRDIQKTCRRHGWEYCPMVRSRPPTFSPSDIGRPLNLARKARNYMLTWGLGKETVLNSADEFVQWLKSKRIVITGRYHTATLCLLTRTPFVAIESNTPKISALLEDALGSNSRVIANVPRLSQEIFCGFSKFDNAETLAMEGFLRRAEVMNKQMIMGIQRVLEELS